MKNLLTTILTLTCFLVSAQSEFPIDKNGNIVYTEVIQSESQTKKQIYEKAKLWIVSTLKSGDNMVELGGDNSDQIVGTGNLLIGSRELKAGYLKEARNVTLNFKFLVFVKDGRYKYEVSNFTLRYLAWWSDMKMEQIDTNLSEIEVRGLNAKNTDSARETLRTEVKKQLEALITDFKKSMTETNANDDW